MKRKRNHPSKTVFTKVIMMLLIVSLTTSMLTFMAAGVANGDTEKTEKTQIHVTNNAQLQVGAAIRDITPTPDMLPLMRKAAGDIVGIIDPIRVRCLALDDGENTALMLSFETGRGPYGPQYVEALAKHTNLPMESIFFTAAHVHAAPEITSKIDLTGDDNYAKWGRLCMDQMLAAADEALANLELAEVGIGYSDSYVNVNRNATFTREDGTSYRTLGYDGAGFSDKKLAAVQFNSLATGKPIAFIVNHAVHGVVMHANEYFDDKYEGVNFTADEKYAEGVLGVSSDIPGYVSNYLEAKFAGSVALWLSGAAGDQNPIVMNEIYTPNLVTGEDEITHIAGGSVAILEYLAKIQFADVLRALSTIETFSSNVPVRCEYGETAIPAKAGGDYDMSLQLFRIGDIAFVGFHGELFNSTGVHMRDNSLLKDTIIVNHTWQRAFQQVGYHPDDYGIEYGGNGTNAKYLPGYIDDALTDLMNNLIVRSSQEDVEDSYVRVLTDTALVGENFQVQSRMDSRYTSLKLVNEQDKAVAIGSVSIQKGDDANTWTFTTNVGTAGNRTFTLLAKRPDGAYETIGTFDITIRKADKPVIDMRVLSASFEKANAARDEKVILTATTTPDAVYIQILNESDKAMGKKLMSRIMAGDTIVWRYEMSVGTAGARMFTVAAAGVNGTYNYNTAQTAIITIDNTYWVDNGDGTATDSRTGQTVLVGADGKAGTKDDNQIVNPAGAVVLTDVKVLLDEEGLPYVALGNGFRLYAGDDGILGTIDDVVKGFGSYPQSDATGGSADPLDWRLLDIQDGKAVLMSASILDGVKFNLNATDGDDWENSNLRSWLNSRGGESGQGDTKGFYDTAFSAEEKAKILLTNVSMQSDSSFIAYNTLLSSDWWGYYTTTGKDTQDYVWSLSGEEAFAYYGRSKIATQEELGHDPANYTNGYFCPTEYAKAQGVKFNTGGNGPSFVGFGDIWLRSSGAKTDDGNYYGVFWGSTGSLNVGRAVNRVYGAAPVIAVSIDG